MDATRALNDIKKVLLKDMLDRYYNRIMFTSKLNIFSMDESIDKEYVDSIFKYAKIKRMKFLLDSCVEKLKNINDKDEEEKHIILISIETSIDELDDLILINYDIDKIKDDLKDDIDSSGIISISDIRKYKEIFERELENVCHEYVEKIENIIKTNREFLDNSIVYVTSFDENSFCLDKYKHESINKSDYNILFGILRDTKICKLSESSTIKMKFEYKINLNKLKKYNIKYEILNKKFVRTIELKELNDIPFELRKLNGKTFSSSSGYYVAKCDENGEIISFLTTIIGRSNSGATVTYKFEKYEFENGYYAVKYSEGRYADKEIYKYHNGKWYRVIYNKNIVYEN
ncbi:hypothetical protein NMF85_10075 [Clostridioides difficile]|uniref:hypothetical protein n=1 Tax=Clostridioides difficile TaxID=1496 RepID=UPI001C1BC365|nr:hypothetical protein [Clostridioides difficile]MCP8415653.1 hypothetical protein [Clostridioides difficile]MCP8664533.1 hypothetical protein [Clostridioides difficile]MDV9368806.1 hypothetical protein [Clostridioides difficile]HBF7930128.1 hypothetical protein [Clostridioides difficile]